MPAKILPCNCKSPQQEALHGNNRVHNLCKGDAFTRCTVCSTEKPYKETTKTT